MKEIYVSLVPGFILFLMVELFRMTFNLLAHKYSGHPSAQAWLLVG
jgi:hypothetical protein